MSCEQTQSASNKNNKITIVSSDEAEFELDVKLAEQSETLAKLIENFDYSSDDVTKMPIPLKNIKKTQMEKIIVWMEHHKNCPAWVPRDKDYVPDYSFGTWTSDYLNIPNCELFELLMASNYLSIPRLYDAASRKVASKIAGKNAEQIRSAFNLTSSQ